MFEHDTQWSIRVWEKYVSVECLCQRLPEWVVVAARRYSNINNKFYGL